MFNFPNSTYGIDSKRQTTAKEFITGMSVIFPGTKWCGPNDNPESYEDLGNFYTTDKCCRGHDHCPHTIPGRSQKYGLWNTGLFTRSHCDCERKFYLCLKDSKSVISGQLGFTYFTLFGPQCFREDYPIIGCGKWGLRRCERYIYDYHGEVKYQWFDNLYF
ncbi:hypothetical protein Zmor_015718 [Zophobas morio]|uniref:Phospholipase A2 n=2 Tax=Zophobas morio TaxID=2755281 RepID=A0AA38MHN0_9CUCU|nr:hypothetical protein Zmor_015718 [Zophobas morio]